MTTIHDELELLNAEAEELAEKSPLSCDSSAMTFEIKKIGEVANVISGFAFKSSDLDQDNEILVIKIGNIQNDGVDFSEGLIESKHENLDYKTKTYP